MIYTLQYVIVEERPEINSGITRQTIHPKYAYWDKNPRQWSQKSATLAILPTAGSVLMCVKNDLHFTVRYGEAVNIYNCSELKHVAVIIFVGINV